MFHRLQSWLSAALMRRRIERDMDDELGFHLEERARYWERTGLTTAEAERRARIEFGAPGRYKEECRESRGLRLTDELRADLLYSVRGIRRNPGFSALVVISFALGIGVNVAMFSVINGVLLRPLPYRNQGRLVVLEERMSESQFSLKNFRPLPSVNFLLHREELGSFEDIVGMDHATYQLTAVAEPQKLDAAWVTANACSFLGVQPALGRCFTAQEEATAAQVALLSYGVWQRQFAADPKIVGRTIALKDYRGDTAVTVVGVLPAGFRFGWDADVWLPLSESRNYRSLNSSWNPALTVARLKPGVTVMQARAEMRAMQRRLLPSQYEGAGGREIWVTSLNESITGKVRPALTVLMGVVGLVLLITCANGANLLLSRGAGKVREVAVRASLGAGRFRICRQMLTESALLVTTGGALGLLIARWVVTGVKLLAAKRLPRADDIHMDWKVLAFAAAVSLVSAILFGLLPAVRLSTIELAEAMKAGGAAAMGGRRHQRVVGGLVVFEVALCVVALMGAGLLIHTFARLEGIDPGFRVDGVVVASLDAPESAPAAARAGKLGEILDRVAALPGIEAAGLVNYAPTAHVTSIQDFRLPGAMAVDGPGGPRANQRVVSPGYFEAVGIPILRGRAFDRRDQRTAPRVILISESVARQYWPGEDPLGKTVLLAEYRKSVAAEIVGIARDARQTGIRNQPDDLIYSTYTQVDGPGSLSLVARTHGDAVRMLPFVKREIRAVDRNQTLGSLTTMSRLMADEVAEPRFYMVLLAGYGMLALLLTAVGIGGLVAYSVSRRTQEIGLRISFGATNFQLLRMFAAGAIKLTVIGLLIGIPGSLLVTRLLRSLLFGVTPGDPATFLSVFALLVTVAGLASCAAAFRAARADPGSILRHE